VVKVIGICGKGETVVDLLPLSRCFNFILARKLTALKVDLKVWNEEVFGHVERGGKNSFE
jgi:hypothetical protein